MKSNSQIPMQPNKLDQSDPDNRAEFDRCDCGRWMMTILSTADDPPGDVSDGFSVLWCYGCGLVHIHYSDESSDSRYTPNPKFKGAP